MEDMSDRTDRHLEISLLKRQVVCRAKLLDDLAPRIGLTVGQEYPLDLFAAERHTPESNVRFETNLRLRPPNAK